MLNAVRYVSTRDDASIGCWSKKALSPLFLHHPFCPMRQILLSMNIFLVRKFRDFSATSKYFLFCVNLYVRYNASGTFELEYARISSNHCQLLEDFDLNLLRR